MLLAIFWEFHVANLELRIPEKDVALLPLVLLLLDVSLVGSDGSQELS